MNVRYWDGCYACASCKDILEDMVGDWMAAPFADEVGGLSPLGEWSGLPEGERPAVPVDAEGEPQGWDLDGELPWWTAYGPRWSSAFSLPLEPQVDCEGAP